MSICRFKRNIYLQKFMIYTLPRSTEYAYYETILSFLNDFSNSVEFLTTTCDMWYTDASSTSYCISLRLVKSENT